ncbi:sensor histidine kinase [Peribacillus sp. B-H-3]|uniref:sensor histidine kinase n=1 Tax=Peribacillus sp. B-H-3 TaxID=3400420 RepID=UPI003B019440
MFQKTRLRLVLLNSAVFICIICLFGTVLYFYMQWRLEKQVDKTIQDVARHMKHEHLDDIGEFLNPENNEENHRLVYLFLGKNSEIQKEMPENLIAAGDLSKLKSEAKSSIPKTIKSGGLEYRSFSILVNKNVKLNGTSMYINRIQLIYNMEREREMLSHLLTVIGFGIIISAAAAILAGLFLANKALVPIQSAWNKQTQFAADASHELRTPLAVMKLNLERLFRHPKSSIEQESESISQAIGEIKYMSKMISDLLILAGSDSNQLELNVARVNLDELLNKAVQSFSELAALKEIKVESNVSCHIDISGDEERLYQLLMILLDNALKYTEEKGFISVGCYVKVSAAHISVADTGAGISAEDLPLIFERFYRGDKARTREFEGTGLGLSIAKWIIEAHGGKIRAVSALGKGSEFLLQLPLCKR